MRHHIPKAKYRTSGFTLIEVMIALAIFVIGALAIVRIFPPALNVIQGSESRSVAMNRSRAYLARSTAQPGLVPDSVYDFTTNTAGDIVWNNYNGSVTGSPTRYNSLPAGLEEADITGTAGNPNSGSALGRFRRIVGERHRVLLNDAPTPSKRFVLSQFAHTATTTPATRTLGSNVDIYVEDRVTGVRVASNGALDFSDARLASDGREFNQRDYNDRSAAPFPRDPDGSPDDMETRPPLEWRGPETIYYVSYRWRDTEGLTVSDDERINGVSDERLTFEPLSTDPNDYRVFMGRSPRDKAVIAGEIGVRVKRFIGNAEVAAGTPEQREGDSIRGYIELPPTIDPDLRSDTADDGSLSYSEVSLIYTVRDWRWLVDDDSPDPDRSTTNVGIVTTPIRFYDSESLAQLSPAVADPLTPVYSLLTFTSDAANVRYTRTADEYKGRWDDDPTTPDGVIRPDNGDDRGVDPKLGRIKYDITPPTANFSAVRARTVYWTLDGWAQQIAVAARTYMPFIPDRAPADRERWREYFWQGNQVAKASLATAADRSVLYFPPSEAGKSVLVTFEHEESTGVYKTQTSVLTIEDKADPGAVPNGASAVFTNQARKAEFRNARTDSNYDVVAILSVQGLSVQSRTAWIENNARYTQAEAVGYRKLD